MKRSTQSWRRVTGKGVYPAEHASWLLSPLRRLLITPENLIRRFDVKPQDHILEIGCGPGYFSPAAARSAPAGRLVILDTQEAMVAMAMQRLERAGAENVSAVVADAAHSPFADSSFDIVFLVTVLGEVSDPPAAMREIARILRPGGRVFITEALGDPDHLSKTQVRSLSEASSLRSTGNWPGLFLRTDVFTRPEAPLEGDAH